MSGERYGPSGRSRAGGGPRRQWTKNELARYGRLREALIRALIAERSQRTNEALFWIRVYRALSSEAIDTIPLFYDESCQGSGYDLRAERHRP